MSQHSLYTPIKEVAQLLGASCFHPDTSELPEDVLVAGYVHSKHGYGSPIYVFTDRESGAVILQAPSNRAFHSLLERFEPWAPRVDGRNIIIDDLNYLPLLQTPAPFSPYV